MKSYTDLSQSKKLAEILPLESADMEYILEHWIDEKTYRHKEEYCEIPVVKVDDDDCPLQPITHPCWSLAALLSVLPFHLIIDNQRYEFSMKKGLNKNGETYAIKYTIFNTTFYFHLTDYYNNPVDACYEMIIKLHEQNLL